MLGGPHRVKRASLLGAGELTTPTNARNPKLSQGIARQDDASCKVERVVGTREDRHRQSKMVGPDPQRKSEIAQMHIERMTLTNFQCFGPDPVTIDFSQEITAFIGANGSGKTAVLQALSRMFGITGDQRRVRPRDFHLPIDETEAPDTRTLSLEVILDFPELNSSDNDQGDDAELTAVPAFFHHMTVEEQGSVKCRLRLDAQWTDDGTVEGAIEVRFRVIRTLTSDFTDDECAIVSPADRTRIQMVYVPSNRDGDSQVAAFMRGRLWRAISWTDDFRQSVNETARQINTEFSRQEGVETVQEVVRNRWRGVVGDDTKESPIIRPVDQRFDELVRRVAVSFASGEPSRVLDLGELGDGQRSLFHIALTLATIDVESLLRSGKASGFTERVVQPPSLTLIALEEPENNLAPFYLSRIIGEMLSLTQGSAHAQGLISSHSASLLGRVPPDDVRHFRLHRERRVSEVRRITLPPEPTDAAKFVRQAVRSYPELYFAKFVVLGEGASEQVVIHRIAEADGLLIDRSFVAVVPLGGRHVNHFWKLLSDLGIPYATLLDLDAGRHGGGWDRIRYACQQLLALGVKEEDDFDISRPNGDLSAVLEAFGTHELDESIFGWTQHLRRFKVFFSEPLDLDFLMLRAFPERYTTLSSGEIGPRLGNEASESAKLAVLGQSGNSILYGDNDPNLFPWYRYLFLGRSKPETHLQVLGEIDDADLANGAPEALLSLLQIIRSALDPSPEQESIDGVSRGS